MTINIRHWSELSAEDKEKLLSRSEIDIAEVSDAVKGIINEVRLHGDKALRELNKRFDKAPGDTAIKVPESHFKEAEALLSQEIKDALEYSVENVRRYHEDQVPDGLHWKEIRPGIMAGERTGPIDSAAFYVPRARGSFPSMLYMMAVPAQIAGVKRIAMASPPDENGRVDPACLYTARL
ncbi:MAG: histidinol dehydrogenase, partial [Spirochaetaceae bacterium]|nr:histidinol dehydrogenase [Spirochaetaceae bacterium]